MTQPPFELRIIRVTWEKKDTPSRIDLARSPIELFDDGRGGYTGETFAYPEVSPNQVGQLGVTVDTEDTPLLILANGTRWPLSAVRADDSRIWWIEKGDWNKQHQSHAPLTRNHAGAARLRIGAYEVSLQIFMPGFSPDEFETLVDEFRTGLWQLILDPKSPTTVTAQRPAGGVNQDYLAAVRDHIRYVRRALNRPHSELREHLEAQPLERVRPTSRTFQELALRDSPRRVTGRGHAPSFDTPENRQLLGMASRLDLSLQALRRAAESRALEFQQRADQTLRRATVLDGGVQVSPERLRQEIAELQERFSTLQQCRARLLKDRIVHGDVMTLRIKVTSVPKTGRHNEIGCFFDWLDEADHTLRPDEKRQLIFRADCDAVEKVFRKGESYFLSGRFQLDRANANDGYSYCTYEVLQLSALESGWEIKVKNELQRLALEQSAIEQPGYRRRLNQKQQQNQKRDQQSDLRRAQHHQAQRNHWTVTAIALKELSEQLAPVLRRARDLGIASTLGLIPTGSMTYVQDPDYRGALAAFRRALEAANLDLSLLDLLFREDRMGILDLPRVYERWCLLKIVRVLTEEFPLVPEQRYQSDLLTALMGQWTQDKQLSIRFHDETANRTLLLEYEPRLLMNGKPLTPDFVITLIDPRFTEATRTANFGPAGRPKLVMDAKLNQFVPIGSAEPGPTLDEKLAGLLDKGYDEQDRNRVFVLHPGRDQNAVQEWQRYCRYGGGHFTPDPAKWPEWDQGDPDHRFGAVLLRPGATDPLIRLIMMHLYLFADTDAGRNTLVPFCPACRGMAFSPSETDPEHSRGRSRAERCCNAQCGQLVVQNYCWSCNTSLFKLGTYWTFHDTRALNLYDIKCPHCGEYMIQAESSDQAVSRHQTWT
jgi:pyrethroid hydrolase